VDPLLVIFFLFFVAFLGLFSENYISVVDSKSDNDGVFELTVMWRSGVVHGGANKEKTYIYGHIDEKHMDH